jgi:sugar phosphate isomerase/epimerase
LSRYLVNTLGEAVSLVKEIDSPAVQTMFDTHNSVAERLPHGDLIKKYSRHIYHIHLNEMDGRHPGTGTYDFRTVLQALKEISYSRWLSVEVFDFSLGGERIAREAAEFIRTQEERLR